MALVSASALPSQPPPLAQSKLDDLWQSAIIEYKGDTNHDLSKDPLGRTLEACTSVDEIISALRVRAGDFEDFRESGSRFWRKMETIAQILSIVVDSAGEVGAAMSGHVPGGKAIFTAIGRLLQATRGVSDAYDSVEKVFSELEAFLKRLKVHAQSSAPVPPLLRDHFVEVLAELLTFVGLLTKYVDEGAKKPPSKRTRTGTFLSRTFRRGKDLGNILLDKNEVREALGRLDILTRKEDLATLTITHVTVQETAGAVSRVANSVDRIADNQIDKDIREWLNPPNPGQNYERLSEERQTGTCEWIFNAEFEEWKRKSNGIYWIYGNPGTGKSVLSSSIIERLSSTRALVAYFYFDFRSDSKQTIIGLLASLVFQLAVHSSPCYDKLKSLRAQNQSMLSPSKKFLTDCLLGMLDLCGEVFIVIDALDECPKSTRKADLLPFLKSLMDRNTIGLRLLATSRLETDIRNSFSSRTITSLDICERLEHVSDITQYIEQELAHSEWPQDIKDKVKSSLLSKANGMFLWANLQLQMLSDHRPIDVEAALDRLPITLNETYERIFERLSLHSLVAERARRILECVAFRRNDYQGGFEPNELAEVLAINFAAADGATLIPDHRPKNPVNSLLETCPGLLQIIETVQYDGEAQLSVQLVHFTVQEYLLSNTLPHNLRLFALRPESAHATLTQACTAAVASSDTRSPLTSYAIYHLGWHARHCPDDADAQRSLSRILHPDNFERSHLRNHRSEQPLFWAADQGLVKQIEFLLALGKIDIDAIGGVLGMALYTAVHSRHLEAAELLIRRGASLEIGDDFGPPLHLAAVRGDTEILAFLLDRGARIDARGYKGRTTLHVAAERISDGDIMLLLERSANVDATDEYGQTPLHCACGRVSASSARLLLEKNAAIEARDKRGWTPLHCASSSYSIDEKAASDLVSLLLERGASLDSCDEDGNTPLHVAAERGFRNGMVHVLLKHGAKIGVANHRGQSPFYLATKGGNLDGACVLLELGASASPKVSLPAGWTILHKAALPYRSLNRYSDLSTLRDHHPILDLFDVEARTDCGQTALSLASTSGNEFCARNLLELGANVNAADSNGFRAIDYAAARGHVDVIWLLLEHGADGWTKSGPCGTYMDIVARTHRANELKPEDWKKGWNRLYVAKWEGRDIYSSKEWLRHIGEDLGDLVAEGRPTVARGERMMRRVRRYRSMDCLPPSNRPRTYIPTIDELTRKSDDVRNWYLLYTLGRWRGILEQSFLQMSSGRHGASGSESGRAG